MSEVQFNTTDLDKDGKVSLSEFRVLENIEEDIMFSPEGSCDFLFVLLVVCAYVSVVVC